MLLCIACMISVAVQAQLRANTRPPRPEVTLPEGPVREVILRNCTQCHGIDEYGYYAMDRSRWNAVIDRMETASSGVVSGVKISDSDRELLLDWLIAEFGPETEPLDRQYVIRELAADEHLDAANARAMLETACNDCHTLEPVRSADLDPEAWRARITRDMGRGAAILIEDVEPLVQWLARADRPTF